MDKIIENLLLPKPNFKVGQVWGDVNTKYQYLTENTMKRELVAGEILKLKDANDEIAQTYVFALTNFELTLTDDYEDADYEDYDEDDFYEAGLENTILALPVSFQVDLATHHDLVFGKNNDYMGIPAMIMTDISRNITDDEVDWTRPICRVSDEHIQQVINLHFRAYRAPYDETIVAGANTGKFNDDDYGVFYDYRNLVAEDVYMTNNLDEIAELKGLNLI